MWHELTHRLFSVWFFALHLFCMHKRQWMGDDRRDGYWFYGLFIYFFVCSSSAFSSFSCFHTLINTIEVKKLMKANRQWRQWRKIESVLSIHHTTLMCVCVFFVCGYKERQKEESSQPFIPWALFSLSGSCYLHIIFLIARLLFTLLLLLFLCVRLLFVPLYLFVCLAFFLLFEYEAHIGHTMLVFFLSLLFSCWTLHKCFMSKQEITFSYLYIHSAFSWVWNEKVRRKSIQKILAWVNVY